MMDFNNRKEVMVTTEEAEARISAIYEYEDNVGYSLAREFARFSDSIYPGATIKAKLAVRADSSNSTMATWVTRPAIFHIRKRYSNVAEASAINGKNKLICYFSIRDLWVDGQGLVIVPTRWEALC